MPVELSGETLADILTDAQKLTISRIFTIVVGLMAILIEGFLNSILGVLILIFSVYMPTIVPLLIITVFKQKYHWQSAMAAMATGLIVFVLWEVLEIGVLPSTLVGMLLSAIAYGLTDSFGFRNKMRKN